MVRIIWRGWACWRYWRFERVQSYPYVYRGALACGPVCFDWWEWRA